MDSSPPRQPKQFSSKVEDHLPELLDALSDHAEFPGLNRQASRFLNSPNSLVGLWPILDNLPEIIEAARQWDSSLIGELDTIASWVAAIAKIPLAHSFRSIEIISKVTQGKDETGRSFFRPPLPRHYYRPPGLAGMVVQVRHAERFPSSCFTRPGLPRATSSTVVHSHPNRERRKIAGRSSAHRRSRTTPQRYPPARIWRSS